MHSYLIAKMNCIHVLEPRARKIVSIRQLEMPYDVIDFNRFEEARLGSTMVSAHTEIQAPH